MSLKTPFQIVIPRRGALCTHGGEPFTKGCEYYSVLVDAAEEGVFERRDYCLACAAKLLSENAFKGVRSLWKSAIPPQKLPSDLPKQREAQALIFLKEALSGNESGSYEEAFILSLYLARRRRLYQRQEIRLADGKEAILYEVPETEEMLCVRKLPLSELQIDKLQVELAKKFKG